MPGHDTNAELTGPVQHSPASATESRAIAALDERECPQCGYPLKGLVTSTCPECGYTAEPDEFALARDRELFMRFGRLQGLIGWGVFVPGSVWLFVSRTADPWDSLFEQLTQAALLLAFPAVMLFVPIAVESFRFMRYFPGKYRAVALRIWLMSAFHLNWAWGAPLSLVLISGLLGFPSLDSFTDDLRLFLPALGLGLVLGILIARARWRRLARISGLPTRWQANARFRQGLKRSASPLALLLIAVSAVAGMMWALDRMAPDWYNR